MSQQEIKIDWLENMAFKAHVDGHEIILDATEAVGGENRGPRPKPLAMVALAGCTGMDVVSILKKCGSTWRVFRPGDRYHYRGTSENLLRYARDL